MKHKLKRTVYKTELKSRGRSRGIIQIYQGGIFPIHFSNNSGGITSHFSSLSMRIDISGGGASSSQARPLFRTDAG